MKNLKFWQVFNIVVPLIIWGFVLFSPYFGGFSNLPKQLREVQLKSILVINIMLIVIFYIHSYLIYPLRERKSGLWLYFAALFVCLCIFMVIGTLVEPTLPKPFIPSSNLSLPPATDFKPNPIIKIFPFVFIVVLSFCHQLYLDKLKRERLIKERENSYLKTELDFLSSQISPHFLFNILNSMVAMARKKSDDLETSLISLSQLMRYMLYDHGQSILLSTEIDYLKNYINLQLIRFKDDVRVNLHINGDFEPYFIAPMLLIPFIENAFKHGIGNIDKPEIDITIQLHKNLNLLKLIVVNSVAKVNSNLEKSSGIGLNNVKRRLELIYPARYVLHTSKKDNTFIALLEINLK